MLGLISLITVVSAVVALPSDVQVIDGPSGAKFAWISAQEITRGEAVEKCLVLGGKLADLKLGADFDHLSKTVTGAAWVNSFEEKSYDGACFAFFEGGAIAVPVGNCASKQGVLCEL